MIDDQGPKIKPTRRHGPPRSNPAQRPSSTGPVNGHDPRRGLTALSALRRQDESCREWFLPFNPIRIILRLERDDNRLVASNGSVSIRCGFVGRGDPDYYYNDPDVVDVFQSGADLWGVGTRDWEIEEDREPFQSGADLWGVGTSLRQIADKLTVLFQSGADLWGVGTEVPMIYECFRHEVSIRCGFVGRGDSTPVCGGSELGKRGASRQPPARDGSVMVLTIMLEH